MRSVVRISSEGVGTYFSEVAPESSCTHSCSFLGSVGSAFVVSTVSAVPVMIVRHGLALLDIFVTVGFLQFGGLVVVVLPVDNAMQQR